MQSKNFDIEILNLNHVQFRVDYYSSNKEHLEIWHPTTPEGFYTFEYQENKVKENLNLINDGQSMHFVMLNKAKNKILFEISEPNFDICVINDVASSD